MSDRVLVTGGLGFVGSALVAYLLNEGYEVSIFDDLSRGSIENVDASRVNIFEGTLSDLSALRACVSADNYLAVVHLAAMHFIPDCNRDPQGCIVTNVVGTENLLSVCDQFGVQRVIAASSMAVYPISDELTVETDAVGPHDVYGETKVANEMQLLRWSRQHAERVAVSIRLANAYGERETNPHVIPAIIEQLQRGVTELELGNIQPFRDYVHVDDIASGIASLIRTPLASGNHVFNLGSGEERSVAQIVEVLGDLLGLEVTTRVDPARVRPVERMHLLPGIRKLSEATGWQPVVDFRDGMTRLCQWCGLAVASDGSDT